MSSMVCAKRVGEKKESSGGVGQECGEWVVVEVVEMVVVAVACVTAVAWNNGIKRDFIRNNPRSRCSACSMTSTDTEGMYCGII
jgi:hypothetical protein